MAILSVLATLVVALAMVVVGYDATVLLVLFVLGAVFVLAMTWPHGARVLGLASSVLAIVLAVRAAGTQIGECRTSPPADGVYLPGLSELNAHLIEAPCRGELAARHRARARRLLGAATTAVLALGGGTGLALARRRTTQDVGS